MAAHLMVPADIGIPMLRGIAPAGFESGCMPLGLICYGFGKDQDRHRTADLSDNELCTGATDQGRDTVFVLQSISLPSRNYYIDCRQGARKSASYQRN
jgi:hypothetical protein